LGLAAALTLALLGLQDGAQGQGPTLVEPPARAPIAGLRGFEVRSTIAYAPAPQRAHELRTAYVFPERVRWWFAARDGPDLLERRLRYRYGRHVFAIETRGDTSSEYVAEDRSALLGAFELRRALFLWPDGFGWSGTDRRRSADLGELGRLDLRLDPGGRPAEIALVDAHGELRDSCRAIAWSVPAEGRAWPASFEVWSGETLAWRETVESVDVETRWIDSFFLPPDRRGLGGAPLPGLRALDIPAVCQRRVALPPDLSWDAARRERARRVAEHQAARGPELEAIATFELGPKGEPRAALLRLARAPEVAPEGFVRLHERVGLALAVHGLGAVGEEPLRALSQALPRGARGSPAYARFEEAREVGDVVLVLAYE
jgi:hypothetical protein